MIKSVCFISRKEFESRCPLPNEVAISIGDPDQETPRILEDYEDSVRLRFLDLEPKECWKHGLDPAACMTVTQAEELANFIQCNHAQKEAISVVVHCEAGVSRSAAVALTIATYAGLALINRHPSFANPHVVQLLADELGVPVSIPAHLENSSTTSILRWN